MRDADGDRVGFQGQRYRTIERASGRVVEGDDKHPSEATEVMTAGPFWLDASKFDIFTWISEIISGTPGLSQFA